MSERLAPALAADLRVGLLAVSAWAGALAGRHVDGPVLAAAGIVALAVAVLPARGGSGAALVLATLTVGVLTSGLAHRAQAGLHLPDPGAFSGVVTLVTDPEPTPAGHVRAEVRADGRRLLAEARTPAAADRLAALLAGDRAVLRGQTSALARPTAWTRARHLAGRLRVEAVVGTAAPSPHAAAANGFRRLLERGTASLPERHRSLLAGLTLGDDRAQPPEMTADFRASGLTHLLAVSGSNVVLMLAVAGPLLRRLRTWPRFAVASGTVLAFAFVTRFEPSVVRAAAMATVALWASTIGRPSGGIRHLAVAVTGLLLVDPLLVRSIGFRLSVAACAGVLVLAPRLAGRLRGPAWVRQALATTVGAQLAVAPVLVPTFWAMPLAALPANVLAAPLAGGLMVWGVTAGAVAGVVGGAAGAALHLPSAVALTALEAVAAASAALPLGHVDLRHVAVLAAAGALVVRGGRWRATGAVLVAGVVLLPGLTPTPPGSERAGWAATVWSDGPVGVVEVDDGASAAEVLDVLRQRRVRTVALVVVRSARPQSAQVVRAMRARLPVRGVIAPPASPVPRASAARPGDVIRVGGLRIEVVETDPVVVARVGWAGSGAVVARR